MADTPILPDGWTVAQIGQVSQINPKHPKETDDSTKVSFVPMASVSDVLGEIVSHEERDFGKVRKGYTHFGDGDVLFAKITPCMENGKSAIVTGMTNGMACGSTEFYVFRPAGVLPGFLHRYLRQVSFRQEAERHMTGAVGQRRVPKRYLESHEIPVPPLTEQRRIADKIDALQAKSRRAREALETVGPLLEKFRQSVLAAAFRGDLTAEWRKQHPDVEPAEKLLERIRAERRARWEEAELAKMRAKGIKPKNDNWKAKYKEPESPDLSNGSQSQPNSWIRVSVSEIATCLDYMRKPVSRKEREKRQGAYPYYGANGQVGTIDDYLFDDELVLVTEDETFYGRTKPIAYRVSGKCWVNNHAHVLQPVPPLSSDLLCYMLMHFNVIPWLSGSTGRAKLTQAALNKLPLPLMPAEEMKELVRIVGMALDFEKRIAHQAETARVPIEMLDQSILAKAFRGELVPQDPKDEPASVLLERIMAEREAAKGKKTTRRKRK